MWLLFEISLHAWIVCWPPVDHLDTDIKCRVIDRLLIKTITVQSGSWLSMHQNSVSLQPSVANKSLSDGLQTYSPHCSSCTFVSMTNMMLMTMMCSKSVVVAAHAMWLVCKIEHCCFRVATHLENQCQINRYKHIDRKMYPHAQISSQVHWDMAVMRSSSL